MPHPLKVLEWALPEYIIFPINRALPVVLIITCHWCTRKSVVLLLCGRTAGHSQQRRTTAFSRSGTVGVDRMLQAPGQHFVRASRGTSTSCHAAPQRLCLSEHCKDAVLQSVSGPKERTVEAEGIEPWLEPYAYILSSRSLLHLQLATTPYRNSHIFLFALCTTCCLISCCNYYCLLSMIALFTPNNKEWDSPAVIC